VLVWMLRDGLMIIEYDCGCVVEYRQCSPVCTTISEASSQRVTQARKGRPLSSEGEIMGNAKEVGHHVQCTWFTPCSIHNPNQQKFRVE